MTDATDKIRAQEIFGAVIETDCRHQQDRQRYSKAYLGDQPTV